jgi:hypothetical protein
MNSPKAFSIPLGFAMAGIIVLSTWGALGPALQFRALPRVTGLQAPAAAAHGADDAKAKLELVRRLGDMAARPGAIKDKDVSAMRRAFGPDAADLLKTLRRADTGR